MPADKTADLLSRLREPRYFSTYGMTDPLCEEAAAEIERLRAGFLWHLQDENDCDMIGQSCGDKCGCWLEMEALCKAAEGDP